MTVSFQPRKPNSSDKSLLETHFYGKPFFQISYNLFTFFPLTICFVDFIKNLWCDVMILLSLAFSSISECRLCSFFFKSVCFPRLCLNFSNSAAAVEANAGPQRALWERDSVLLQPAAGLHQCAHTGWQHPGDVTTSQLGEALHPQGICHGAETEPLEHAAGSSQRGETQCHQTQSQWDNSIKPHLPAA